MEASKHVKVAATTAVFVLRSCMPSLTEAEAVNLLRDSFQQMATEGSSHEEHSGVVTGTSPTAADSRGPTASSGQRGYHGPPPVAAVPPITAGHTLPLDEDAVSRFRKFTKEVKAGRLLQAAKYGPVSELQALLAAGADVRAVDKRWGKTSLHWAAARGDVEAVRCLIDGGAPVDYLDNRWWTPLHEAAIAGKMDVVKLLLASSADPNKLDRDQKSPLQYAVQFGYKKVATVLVDAGADTWARDGTEIIRPGDL